MDRELAAALAGELPVTANVEPEDAQLVTLSCPPGATGAAFDLPNGRITVLLLPPNVAMTADASAWEARGEASTSTGKQLVIVSEPATPGGSVPYESDLTRFATDLTTER